MRLPDTPPTDGAPEAAAEQLLHQAISVQPAPCRLVIVRDPKLLNLHQMQDFEESCQGDVKIGFDNGRCKMPSLGGLVRCSVPCWEWHHTG